MLLEQIVRDNTLNNIVTIGYKFTPWPQQFVEQYKLQDLWQEQT